MITFNQFIIEIFLCQFNFSDIAAAARAAVSGDEVALDMFTFTKTSSLPKFNMPSGDTIQLFFGTADGNVFYIDDQGRCSSKFTVDGSVKSLIYYEKRDVVLTITESLMLTQHRVKSDGETTEIVKVSGLSINFFEFLFSMICLIYTEDELNARRA